MSKVIRLNVSEAVLVGKQFTFKAPCAPDEIEGLYINGVTYNICDTLGNSLCKKSNAWKSGTLVSVVLDTDSTTAFILNNSAYLPLSGGNLVGDLLLNNNRVKAKYFQSDTYMSAAVFRGNVQLSGDSTYYTATIENLVTMFDGMRIVAIPHVNGTNSSNHYLNINNTGNVLVRSNVPILAYKPLYMIYHERYGESSYWEVLNPTQNEPTGSYTGNGDSTTRLITTGGTGDIIFIWSSASDFGFLTPSGGLMLGNEVHYTVAKNVDGIQTFGFDQKASYQDGTIRLATNHEYLNKSGVVYYYQCI